MTNQKIIISNSKALMYANVVINTKIVAAWYIVNYLQKRDVPSLGWGFVLAR